jgi:hypothetical protein
MAKSLIYYHRAYRKITGSGRSFLIEMILISVPLFLLILFGYPLITKAMSNIAQGMLSPYYSEVIRVLSKPFLLGETSYIGINGLLPSTPESIVNIIISLFLVILLPRAKRNKNIAIYFVFLAAINLVSSIYFALVPHKFPYTLTDFSELYIKSEIGMWLFIPFILGMAFIPLPAPFFPKVMLIAFTILYSFIFGTFRYIVFLFILSKCSMIYMAVMFFAFGPLIDFVYIVGIYSYYNSKLAHSLKSNESVWKWSY